ncbi:stress responsive A/B barrel domain protein [Xylariomycetidae sp. FL2044]|nr:stress responsive A/B barrel domain protein [Xylariomycetidae sp. FL2044]
MTICHTVLFKFREGVSEAVKQTFATELRKLKSLPSIQNQRLWVASVITPVDRSKGFQYKLVSFHKDQSALDEYIKSDAHLNFNKEHFMPYKGGVIVADFEDPDGMLSPPQ